MTRVLIADDHTLFRAGLRRMLESFPGIAVAGEAADADATAALAGNVSADVLICDLAMPGASGTQLIDRLHREQPALPILVLSMHDEPAIVRRALQSGAAGFLTKEASPDALCEAILRVAHGGRYVSPSLAEQLALDQIARPPVLHETLSARESQIFALIVKGVSLAQIAEQLHLSPKTITTHKTHLMEKLGVTNNADLVRYAVQHRLFD